MDQGHATAPTESAEPIAEDIAAPRPVSFLRIFPRRRRTSPPKMPRHPISLQARLLGAAGVALFAFLGLTAFALDQAHYQSAVQALQDRLQSFVWAYLSGSDISVSGTLILPEIPPDTRFDRPQSGLYAAVLGGKINWVSPSALGRKLPFSAPLKPGERRFVGPLESDVGPVFVFSEGVVWPVPNGGDVSLTFNVAESTQELDRQIGVYRRTLAIYLGGAGIVLLLLEVAVLRLGLRPVRQVSRDLAAVERGTAQRLSGPYPRELEGLATTINEFIDSERDQRDRYRNTLADLAHSLKTPLAVVWGELEGDKRGTELRGSIADQIKRMNEIVAYQLSRAATSGHKTLPKPQSIETSAEQIVRGLEKVYAERGILCEFEIDSAARFYGELGDLLELLGNLLENAFKWARSRVVLTAEAVGPTNARRLGLKLVVEDDGPGIPEGQAEYLLSRGARGDERVQGHGIGLAIVQDVLETYRGQLVVGRSPTLGGASFTIRFPATP